MKPLIYICLTLGLIMVADADTMTLNNGQVVKGHFVGFTDRKFQFKPESGAPITEYPINIKSIVPDAPLRVSAVLTLKNYEEVEFRSFDEYTLHLVKDDNEINERVILLKKLTVIQPPEPVAPPPQAPAAAVVEEAPKKGEAGTPDEVREWKRTGKWREMESKNSTVISKGEEVAIEDSLKKGFVNIVHFHYPKALASIREGNYVEAIAAKPARRIVVLKVLTPDFKSPICEALGIKSLPQFWFYDAQGRLVKKLTDRFTEGDIDAAIKLAKQGAN